MNIGEKIKEVRIKNGLTQEELANRSELSKGFISQVERDLTSPSIATLVDILECLGTNLKDFFAESLEEKIVFQKEDTFVSENKELQSQTCWIVPNSQKNLMEPIIVELDKNGKTMLDLPHEGEEFGYVLNGAVYVNLGSNRYKVKKGESFYYKSDRNHFIENATQVKATVLWVSTPPNF